MEFLKKVTFPDYNAGLISPLEFLRQINDRIIIVEEDRVNKKTGKICYNF